MRSLMLQILAVSWINLKSIPQRIWLSLSTVVAIGLVVTVLLAFLAMGNCFQRTIAGSGANDIAVILRSGSRSVLISVISPNTHRLVELRPRLPRRTLGQ